MNSKQKLELTWIGKENQPKLEPRILIEDALKSYGIKNTDNMLISGDNLLALKALEQDFAGKIKCIYIDPPYNTGSAFEHYDDGLEHSIWLSLIRDRLILLRNLLSDKGSIWISIDDNECHYLKVLCDELFGRKNFVANIIWEKVFASKNSSQYFSTNHDHLLVYAKTMGSWKRNLLPRSESQETDYKNPDSDIRGPWISVALSARNFYSLGQWSTKTPSGRLISGPPKGRFWTVSPDKFRELCKDNRIWWGQKGDGVPRRKVFLSEVQEGIVPPTIWTHQVAGNTQEAKKEVLAVVPPDASVFATPKPERLLQQILTVATDTGDIVLDSFLGSGTTAAVAHKMRRRYIGIELGEHCDSHCLPRLRKVVDGTDEGGITKAVDWRGGGGFKYYSLAPSLLKQDKYGHWIIDEHYKPEMLAAAMAKQEGFKYSPDETYYWKQGQSTEKDYIFTTTNFVTVEHLDKIHDEMQPDESLLICCKSFQKSCETRYPNMTIKKIPKMLLGRCEFGKDDYSLNIVNMPVDADTVEPDDEPVKDNGSKKKPRKGHAVKAPDLFGGDGEE